MNMMTQVEESSRSGAGDSASPSSHVIQRPKRAALERIAWFRHLSIRGKVHAIFGVFFFISFAMALILALGLGELRLRYSASEKANDALYEAVELRSIAGDLRYASARFVLTGEQTVLEQQRNAYENAKARINAIDHVTGDTMPSLRPQIARMRSNLDRYNGAFIIVTTAQQQGANPERLSLLGQRLTDSGEQLVEATRKLADGFIDQRERSQAAGLTYFAYMIAALMTLGGAAAMILGVGLRYFSKNVSQKILEISKGMTALARGERDFTIKGHDRKDEFGEMLRALAMFKRANKQLELWAHERSERADQEMRLQQERETERKNQEARKTALLHDVALEFERTVGDVVSTVATASGQLGTTASKMASTADEASERTSDLARHMQEASIGATAAAAASDQFALSISEISQQATSSSAMARLAHDATEEADTTISALSDSADQIGQVVELIQTIAQRTNLLALNASIEAARGGEAGRGFAVVASEVKELAMQTSRATREVAHQICAMQDKTGESVAALRAIANQVRDLDSTTMAIASAVNQQSVAGQDLARNIDLAARGTDKVNGHVDRVRQLSLSTGTAANQVLASANELEHQASTLNAQVTAFLNRVREG
ncbi:MAG: methyl-accepting chemotaxis protein [Erythrobacter sp.]